MKVTAIPTSREPAILVNYEPAEWGTALRAAAPGLDIRDMPALGAAQDVDCIVTWKVEDTLLDRLPNLKLVYAVGAGVDYLVDQVRRRPGLRLARVTDEAMAGDVATLAVAGVLQGLRQLPAYLQQQARREWKPLSHRSSSEATVCILGLGHIGSTVARCLRPLGFEVCGWSRSAKRMDGVHTFHGEAGLREVLARSDIVVCTLPLTPETAGILGREAFSLMPRGGFLVNVGRGGHVDEKALLDALDSGHLGGAFLDVFAKEPLPSDHPLWNHPAVQITPHVASKTLPRRVAPQLIDNVLRLRSGAELNNLVDPEAGY